VSRSGSCTLSQSRPGRERRLSSNFVVSPASKLPRSSRRFDSHGDMSPQQDGRPHAPRVHRDGPGGRSSLHGALVTDHFVRETKDLLNERRRRFAVGITLPHLGTMSRSPPLSKWINLDRCRSRTTDRPKDSQGPSDREDPRREHSERDRRSSTGATTSVPFARLGQVKERKRKRKRKGRREKGTSQPFPSSR
jgi:hypothetical protein